MCLVDSITRFLLFNRRNVGEIVILQLVALFVCVMITIDILNSVTKLIYIRGDLINQADRRRLYCTMPIVMFFFSSPVVQLAHKFNDVHRRKLTTIFLRS